MKFFSTKASWSYPVPTAAAMGVSQQQKWQHLGAAVLAAKCGACCDGDSFASLI